MKTGCNASPSTRTGLEKIDAIVQLNVPFIPDAAYADFLAGLGEKVFALHFSLNHADLCDARIRLRTVDEQTVIALLGRLPGPRKYLLANGRFHPPRNYHSDGGLAWLVGRLEKFEAAGLLDGIIFSDAYMLLALSDAAPHLASRLEAVPSINFAIDSVPRLDATLAIVESSRFRLPGKITLDRSVNRHPAILSDLARAVRRRLPRVKLELLVNEGCLAQCPFRSTHEALIAAANAGIDFDTFRLNRDLGCMRQLNQTPHLILASPFIRPEDLGAYTGEADIFKVCGRTLGRRFLMRAVGAYVRGRYQGNLTDLLDASNWLGERWEIPNQGLPEDFLETVTACGGLCRDCRGCREMFRRTARPRPFGLPEGITTSSSAVEPPNRLP